MIRGQKRDIISPAPTDMEANIHNRFDIEVVDSITGKIKQRAQAENIILNQWWTKFEFGNYYNHFYGIAVGTGTSTPVVTDTSLTNQSIGTASDVSETSDKNTLVYSIQKKRVISESQLVGVTITEVGITNNNNYLITRALLKDMNGNTISITKTNTDIINVYATTFLHFVASDAVKFTGCKALSAKLLARRLLGGSLVSSLNARVGFRSAIMPDGISASTTWTPATKTLTFSLPRLSASQLNGLGGIDSICFDNGITCYSSEFMTGSDIVGEAIATGDGVKKDFTTAFGYARNAKIYVNGVEDTSVVVDPLLPHNITEELRRHMRLIDSSGNTTGILHPLTIIGAPYNANFITSSFSEETETIFENPLYSSIGMTAFNIDGSFGTSTLLCSNDLQTWTTIGKAINIPISAQYQNYRYWKIIWSSTTLGMVNSIAVTATSNDNIHFLTPPASGAVITADYNSNTIAKDVNHVFDFSLSIQLGEYTP